MVRNLIKKDLEKACKKLRLKVEKIIVDYVPDPKLGDYTTNLPLQQHKQAVAKGWQSPEEIAKKVIEAFGKPDYLEKIEFAAPGFINFFLSKLFLDEQIGQILEKKEKFSEIEIGKGKKARVEFVSANPTGPLHIGNARGGPIGDVIASVLEVAGYRVLREYLHNDIGGQVEKFGKTLVNLQRGDKLDEQEYKGTYLAELLEKIRKNLDPKETAKQAVEIMFGEIINDCRHMGIEFDRVYRESEIEAKYTDEVLKKLKRQGVLRRKLGAVWFAPNDEYLADREAVVIKSNGEKTYFANDIAYHDLKFSAGFDLVIDELGTGHDGHIPKLKSAVASLGHDVEKFKVVVYQNVRVKKGGEIIKMSKRAGNFVTAREVLDEVGRDAFRFFMLMSSSSTHMDFDLELAKKKAADNPVYYVQYAHARICSILRKSGEGFQVLGESKNLNLGPKTLSLLTHYAELSLIKKLIQLPELVEDISHNFQVHRLTSYAVQTANLFHKFYEQCRVISDDKKLSLARLGLVSATRIVLQNTLKLLGVSAPERM